MSRDSFSVWGSSLPIDHSRGGPARYHYVAFTKIPRGRSRPLGFSSLINTVPLHAGGVTNKSKTNEPRHPAAVEQVLCLDPIDGTTAKPTIPQVPIINQLRASIPPSWLYCFLGWSSNEQVLTERYSGNNPCPLKCHKSIIITRITSSYYKYSHHVHWFK
jgi:hypothetical protein